MLEKVPRMGYQEKLFVSGTREMISDSSDPKSAV